MRIGIVADDITGSNDIGIMFAKSGLLTHVYTYEQAGDYSPNAGGIGPEVVILDTNSRLDDRTTAYQKVYAAARDLAQTGCRQFFNKTCSVFRGNIGAEFDAMLDALGKDFAVVVLGFPKNGRTTVDGIHYVHGRMLEDSEFRSDPIHPMRISSLVDILQSQTQRRVGSIPFSEFSSGPEALRWRLDQVRSQWNYAILDVIDQDTLKLIAAAVKDEPVLCGSSALGEELPAAWDIPVLPEPPLQLPPDRGEGILTLAGSLMPQSAAQIEVLKASGVPSFELETACLFDPQTAQAEVQAKAFAISELLAQGNDVLLHSPNAPEKVDQYRRHSRELGLDPTEAARRVTDAIASVALQVRQSVGLDRLVVAGGETSAAVCDKLGIRGMAVWKEIQPGLPSCISLGDHPVFLVLKSGSFGRPDFLVEAVRHLRTG